MNNLLQIIVLGAVQGATEFIPVSSSGHLELVPAILNWPQLSTSLILFAHFGTFLALVVYFRNEIVNLIRAALVAVQSVVKQTRPSAADAKEIKLLGLIILAAIPAAILGLIFQNTIEAIYDSQPNTEIAWLITAVAMIVLGFLFLWLDRLTESVRVPLTNLPLWRIVVIGCAQAIAFVRGVSRSGITIFTGQLMGLDRVDAAKFSFLVSLPILLGTSLLSIVDLVRLPAAELNDILLPAAAIFLSSFIFGWIAISYLLKFLQKNNLDLFGFYRIAFGIIAILVILF